MRTRLYLHGPASPGSVVGILKATLRTRLGLLGVADLPASVRGCTCTVSTLLAAWLAFSEPQSEQNLVSFGVIMPHWLHGQDTHMALV